jgi:hypothetical protein
VVTLDKAYRITGDEKFTRGLIDLWHDWRHKNPYPMDVNWPGTLEGAFRAHSWLSLDGLNPTLVSCSAK